MSFDAHKALAKSTVATAPSPASSGLSLVVAAGTGARFPAVPFYATVQAASAIADPTNAEVIKVTARSTDTMTITRAQQGTTARSIQVGDLIYNSVTPADLVAIEAAVYASLEVALPTGYTDPGTKGNWAVDETNGVLWQCYATNKWFTLPIALA